MRARKDKKLYRIIDANFNRAKEGLRVCEDICRFILDAKGMTRQYKAIRHSLTEAMKKIPLETLLVSRDIEKDIGKKSIGAEFKRREIFDIFYANSQRIKESVRVLEEIFKLIDKKAAQDFKEVRYSIYGLEKKVIERF